MDDFEQLDYYSLLGVGPLATADEIKHAYRQQMARFHPDRFASAPPEQQGYVSRRARRLNEAYAVLSNVHSRRSYDHTHAARRPGAYSGVQTRPAPAPVAHRDYLAELYHQACSHIAAGHHLQAAATLREIQQINPFYRDSATLLAQAELAAHAPRHPPIAPPPPPMPDRGRRALVVGGLGAVLLAGLGAAGWSMRGQVPGLGFSGATAPNPPPPGEAIPLAGATAPPASTGGRAEPVSAAPPPQPTATATPPPQPTATATTTPPPQPTATPPPQPTVPPSSPTPAPLAEEGRLLYAEDFSTGRGWPSLSGRGWSVGFAPGGYQITATQGAGNIWAYSTSPAGRDFLIGVDVTVAGGLGGLLLRFSESGYLACFLNPAVGSYRVVRRTSAGETVLIEEAHPALVADPTVANRLVARLQGLSLAVRINGQPVTEQTVNSPPPTARYGLVAIAQGAQVAATFANLAIREL